MLGASHWNPAISHGIIAFSAYYESLSSPADASSSTAQARKHHAMSLSSAATKLNSQHFVSTEEVLLLCLLFHALELFRHRFHDSYVHLQAAVKIVDNMSSNQLAASSVAKIIHRLKKQPQSNVDSLSMAMSASMPLLNVDSAWQRLMQIHGWICASLSVRNSDGIGILSERFQLRLLEWKIAFDELFNARQAVADKFESKGLQYLRILHGLIDLSVVKSALRDSDQNASLLIPQGDGLVQQVLDDCCAFAGVRPLAKKPASHTSTPRSVHFGFDTEFILIILFLATATQSHQLRQQAITIMRSAHRQEGSWDSFYAAHIIECFDRRAKSDSVIISKVAYFHDHMATGSSRQSFDFSRPNLACCELVDQGDSDIPPTWFHCSCDCSMDCGSTSSDQSIAFSSDYSDQGPLNGNPVWEQTEFTPSLVTQIFSAAQSQTERTPYHFGSAMIAVNQDLESLQLNGGYDS